MHVLLQNSFQEADDVELCCYIIITLNPVSNISVFFVIPMGKEPFPFGPS